VPDVVKLCLWCGNSLCIGIKKEYDRIDIENGSMKELFRSELPQLAGCNVPSFDNNMLLCSKHQLQSIRCSLGFFIYFYILFCAVLFRFVFIEFILVLVSVLLCLAHA
jgi:hypothetical protein